MLIMTSKKKIIQHIKKLKGVVGVLNNMKNECENILESEDYFKDEDFINALKKITTIKFNLEKEIENNQKILSEMPMVNKDIHPDEDIDDIKKEEDETLTINLSKLKGLNFTVKEDVEMSSKIQKLAEKFVDKLIDDGNIFSHITEVEKKDFSKIFAEMSDEQKDSAAQKMVDNVEKKSKDKMSDEKKEALKAKFKANMDKFGKK